MFVPQINTVDGKDYYSKHHNNPIKLISNPNKHLYTKQKHKIFLPILCVASYNPLDGSYIAISYKAKDYFLEIFSIEKYLQGFIGHSKVRDIEFFIQEIAQDFSNALNLKVKIKAKILLNGLKQEQIIKIKTFPLID